MMVGVRDFFLCGLKHFSVSRRQKHLFRSRDTISGSHNISDTWCIYCMLCTHRFIHC